LALIDSHCHLDDEQFNSDREAAIARALEAGVERMVVIGTGDGPPDLESAIRLADKHEQIYATVGIHPQHAAQTVGLGDVEGTLKELGTLLSHPKCVALGEIGLDYYWKPIAHEEQHRLFRAQLEIARDASKPIVIHTRDAWDDTLQILEEHWAPSRLPCVLHCFTGGPDIAQRALALGFYLSFAGVLTYPKATEVHASAKMAPLDRILLETDAPYLAPVPYRGKRNEPSYVVHTARFLAGLRSQEFEEIAQSTTSNWQRVFLRYTE
jgi:TatD DNase family protein